MLSIITLFSRTRKSHQEGKSMKEWSIRQLRSYMDAHEIEYQSPYPPMLKDKHYHRYLLKVLARHGRYRPDQECKMRELKPMRHPLANKIHVSLICPTCLYPVREDGACDCTDGERFDGGTAS